MAKHRAGRINDEMQKQVAEAMREIKDPRVSGAFVSVTAVEVTPDLKFAKIYYSSLRGDKKEVAKGLASSSGFVRGYISRNMNLRITPELTFVEDHSIEHGARIASLMKQVEEESKKHETEQGEDREDV